MISETPPPPHILSAAQCRAARALLGITQGQLAELSRVAKGTIAGFEMGRRQTVPAILESLRITLETGGVGFSDPSETSFGGVHLKKGMNDYWPGPLSPEEEADNFEHF